MYCITSLLLLYLQANIHELFFIYIILIRFETFICFINYLSSYMDSFNNCNVVVCFVLWVFLFYLLIIIIIIIVFILKKQYIVL